MSTSKNTHRSQRRPAGEKLSTVAVGEGEEYKTRPPDKDPGSGCATAKAPRPASVQPGAGFPAQASQSATRKARAQMEIRRAPIEAAHDEARGQPITPMEPPPSTTRNPPSFHFLPFFFAKTPSTSPLR